MLDRLRLECSVALRPPGRSALKEGKKAMLLQVASKSHLFSRVILLLQRAFLNECLQQNQCSKRWCVGGIWRPLEEVPSKGLLPRRLNRSCEEPVAAQRLEKTWRSTWRFGGSKPAKQVAFSGGFVYFTRLTLKSSPLRGGEWGLEGIARWKFKRFVQSSPARQWQTVRLRPCPAGERRVSYAGRGKAVSCALVVFFVLEAGGLPRVSLEKILSLVLLLWRFFL